MHYWKKKKITCLLKTANINTQLQTQFKLLVYQNTGIQEYVYLHMQVLTNGFLIVQVCSTLQS